LYFLSDEEPAPHKAKKTNKSKWCRGRKGILHEPEIIEANHYSWKKNCGFSEYKVVGGGTKRWYSCRHQRSCKNCGKILEWSLKNKEDCPDWQKGEAVERIFRRRFAADLDNLPIEE